MYKIYFYKNRKGVYEVLEYIRSLRKKIFRYMGR